MSYLTVQGKISEFCLFDIQWDFQISQFSDHFMFYKEILKMIDAFYIPKYWNKGIYTVWESLNVIFRKISQNLKKKISPKYWPGLTDFCQGWLVYMGVGDWKQSSILWLLRLLMLNYPWTSSTLNDDVLLWHLDVIRISFFNHCALCCY